VFLDQFSKAITEQLVERITGQRPLASTEPSPTLERSPTPSA
jgi:hypothetical protein